MVRVLLLVAALAAASAQLTHADVEMRRSVVGSGGGVVASPTARYAIASTIGQDAPELANSASFLLRGGFWLSRGRTPTDVVERTAIAPIANKLYANYPNPFNPMTTIQYALRRQARARLRLYDVGGKLVRGLLDRIESPGRKSIVWNGLDDQGRPVSSGIYICVLEVDEYRGSTKLVVLR